MPAPGIDWMHPDVAKKVVGVIEDIAQEAVKDAITYRTGTVASLFPGSMTVEFPDEPDNFVPVALQGFRPKVVGQNVEVLVRNGTEFVLNRVFGETVLLGGSLAPVEPPVVATGLALTTANRAITATWDVLVGIDAYDVQRAKDSGFTEEVTLHSGIFANQFTVENLTPGDVWFFRVRGVNTLGPGEWSDDASIQVARVSDGVPPESSPTVTVHEGIRMLTAEWLPQDNDDPVTYEVHIGTVTNFAPTAGTKLGETSSTYWSTDHLPNGDPLDVEQLYFMRVIAKDVDGAAPPSGQGSGQVIDLSQVVSYETISGDGFIPSTPAAPAIQSGIGYLYASWTRPASPDPLQYEVHVSTTSAAFVPDANTLSLVTSSLFAIIRKQGPGAGNLPLVYGTTYYVKLIAVDVDGYSAPSAAGSGFTVKANTADIAVGAITAASGIIGNLAVGTAQIQDIAITTAKIQLLAVGTGQIADLAVGTAKIGDLAVTTAKVQDLAVNTAKIADLAVTNAKIGSIQASKITTDTLNATITVSGVIRTSSGLPRVEMNSGGLFMYDSGGSAVIQMNASTGTAYFQGNIYAINGTFTGSITSSATITGGTFQTASSGTRIVISSGSADQITWYNPDNTFSGYIQGSSNGSYGDLALVGMGNAYLTIQSAGGTVYIGSNSFSRSVSIMCGASGSITFSRNPRYGSYEMINALNIASYVPLASVNGYTGNPYLSYADVGAASSGHGHAGAYLTGGGSEQPTFAYVTASAFYTGGNYIGPNTATSMRVGASGAERYLSLSSVSNGATKTFVINHPRDKKKHLVHAAIEGPTADVFYRGEGQLIPDDGYMEENGATRVARVVIELPGYFEALTEVQGRTVTVTPIVGQCECGEYLAPSMGASPVRDGRFVVYALAGFTHNCARFYWEVKAARKGTKFDVEPDKSSVKLQGDGPYTYLVPA